MVSKLNAKKILARNPGIDRKVFREAMVLLNLLRDSGVKSAQYDLKSPFHRYEGTQEEQKESHPRTVRLKP